MRSPAVFLAALAFGFISRSRKPAGAVTRRGPDARPDLCVYQINNDECKIATQTAAGNPT